MRKQAIPIKVLVDNPEWQKLRESFLGTWKTQMGPNLAKLRSYLGKKPWKDEDKLRRVQNMLGALKRGGFKDDRIDTFLEQVKSARSSIG